MNKHASGVAEYRCYLPPTSQLPPTTYHMSQSWLSAEGKTVLVPYRGPVAATVPVPPTTYHLPACLRLSLPLRYPHTPLAEPASCRDL